MFPFRILLAGVILLLLGFAALAFNLARSKPRMESLPPELLVAAKPQQTPDVRETPEEQPTPPDAIGRNDGSGQASSQQTRIKSFAVKLLTPSMAETFKAPANVELKAAANHKRDLKAIEFYTAPEGISVCQSVTSPKSLPDGSIKIGETRVTPFEFEWANVPVGIHTIVAVASYETGEREVSAPIVIVVNGVQDFNGPKWQGWRPPYSPPERPEQDFSLLALPTPTPTLDSCPRIVVTRPIVSPPSNMISFQATAVGNEVPADLKYNWKVSAGEIASGQGTSTITVAVNKILDNTVVANVAVERLHGICPNSAFLAVSFEPPPWITDDFRNLLLELREKSRLDRLKTNAATRHYIQLSGERDNCVDGYYLQLAKLLKRYLVELRGFKSDQILIVNAGRIKPDDQKASLELTSESPEDPETTLPAAVLSRPLVRCRGSALTPAAAFAPQTPINRKCPDIIEPIVYRTALETDASEINTCPYNPRDPQNTATQVLVSSKPAGGNYASFPTFAYWTNGGRILSKGSQGIWDLSDWKLRPGTYAAIAKSDDGCDCNSIQATTVRVTNFCTPCLNLTRVCRPQSDVMGLQNFQAEAREFAFAGRTTFNWTTTKGRIISGQGSPDIIVDTNGLPPGSEFNVTVAVGGLQHYCVNKLSVSAVVEEFWCGPRSVVLGEHYEAFNQRRARRRHGAPGNAEVVKDAAAHTQGGEPLPPDEGPVPARTNEKEWLKISWMTHVYTDDSLSIEVVYNRTTESFQVSNAAGELSEELKVGKLLKDWFGKDYETLGDLRLKTAGLICDSCNQEQYQSFDKEKLEWSWPVKPTGKGMQSFKLELWIRGQPRDSQSGKQPRPAEKVWWRSDLKVAVAARLLTRNTVFAGGGLCVVLGFGLCIRGLKIYRIGDTYNVGQAVAVGRNVTVNNATVNQQSNTAANKGDKQDA